MKISIREANENDMTEVFNLVQELAVFEKEPDAIEIDVAYYIENGFKKTPLFKCFVAEIENSIVGIALIYNRFSTWKGKTIHIEDLIVTKKFRNKGIGNLLFERVINYANETKVKRVSWEVLDWNINAIDFYKKKGAKLKDDWKIFHLSGKNLLAKSKQ